MSQDSLIGRTVAGYRLVQHVGEGGTATVYKAEHPERGVVALKVLRARLAQDPVAIKRFLREAEFGTRVNHPNIVRTYDYGQTDDLYYLAMEWVDGEALEKFAIRSGPLAPPLVATIIEQIGAALTAAHAENIIHRDLKPANIMYNPATQRAVLLDFGIARDVDLKPEERLTRTGFFVGTLQYVAPEALSGELVNEQADVYSLATIAYYLLAGTLPYSGRSPRELFQQLLTQPPIPLNQAVKSLKFPDAVEAAVMVGLERDLGKRSKTVDEFTANLCTALRQGGGERKSFLKSIFGK
ncbi:MAG TPA: serine/threonine-protein kinase [Gemmatimonadales bacterium]|jgi:serine/threonine-protein kinase|nr:serine/threonine-protein kinase [Gemmatimonadales bacterium]